MQLADMLTKAQFTANTWNPLMQMCQVCLAGKELPVKLARLIEAGHNAFANTDVLPLERVAYTVEENIQALMPLNQFFVIEVFGGSRGLTAAIQSTGLRGIAIDWKHNRFKPKIQDVMHFDLSTKEGQTSFWNFVRQNLRRIIMFWIALPCQTLSRARAIPQPGSTSRPLRDSQDIDLTPTERDLLNRASILIKFTLRLEQVSRNNCVLWVIENPERSLLWDFSHFKSISEHEVTHDFV